MIDNAISLGSALLLGLAASGHCAVMCGGIAGALSLAIPRELGARRRSVLLGAYQLGRISSYALAGASIGGLGWALMPLLDHAGVRLALRGGVALLLIAIAAALLLGKREPGSRLGGRLWLRVAPLARRLMPVRQFPSALLFGAIWGWMPCGFVYSVLILAWLHFDPVQSAMTMLAFGVGTLPGVVAAHLGAPWLMRRFGTVAARRATGVLLVLFALVTIAAPLAGTGHGALHAQTSVDCSVAP
ncbi:sulfite exporter TauE/SafE family protein [Tahibacter amnicola]|uniref:Sulfite exporter TauE/SafE family protein n=1 Tax=Tahibacter amnicola TaxID=2976241 RepID=A0ABY6B9D4_9GAMM|nr:sulfite exporter TauE/SafE family protein [Tahibacter amnicola]UXI66480.1 sulfite exporter TauE/SafE family protein [Tahibacter amnicola]